MTTLQKPSPRAVLIQVFKQIICIGMVIIVMLPILVTVFAAFKTRADMVNTSPLALPPSPRWRTSRRCSPTRGCLPA